MNGSTSGSSGSVFSCASSSECVWFLRSMTQTCIAANHIWWLCFGRPLSSLSAVFTSWWM